MSMPPNVTETAEAHNEGLIKQAGDMASNVKNAVSDEMGHLGGQAQEVAGDLAQAAKDHPYATMAIAAGLAFAVGALWKAGSSRQPSQIDALLARMPDLPSRNQLWPRSWR